MASRTAFPGTATDGTTHAAADDNKLPGGWIGYVEVTADQTGITTEVDLTGLSVTVTVNTSRRIRVTGSITMSVSVTDTAGLGRIKESTTVLRECSMQAPQVTGGPGEETYEWSVILTPSSGAHTYKLSLARSVGSGTVSSKASTTRNAYLLVEDLGPAS